jgi:hypothetical protein
MLFTNADISVYKSLYSLGVAALNTKTSDRRAEIPILAVFLRAWHTVLKVKQKVQ